MPLTLDTQRTALLCMDFQRDIALPDGALGPSDPDAIARHRSAIAQTRLALDAARAAGLPVIHVRVACRPTYDGVNKYAPMGQFFQRSGALVDGSPGAEIIEELAPIDGEPVVTKRMVSAFVGTDLESILRRRGIETLWLSGLVTHFVVEGTGRHGADLGYRIVTLTDCCTSGGLERHQAALDILGRIGALATSADLASALATKP